jgi:hypothetical protein
MGLEVLNDFLKLMIPPAVGVLVTAAVTGAMRFVGERRKQPALPEGRYRPIGSTTLTPRPEGAVPIAAEPPPARVGRLVRIADRVRAGIDALPPLKRRANPWKATLVGGFLFGFGVAGYFRTWADALVGAVLSIPFLIAVPFISETTGESTGESNEANAPFWVYLVAYSSMGLTALYSYLRARSANRRLEGDLVSGRGSQSAEVRNKVLKREIAILAADRWRVEWEREFEALLSRIKRPNHLLHGVLTLMTLYLWAFVWIAKTRESRRKQELEYRRISVDEQGEWAVEPLPEARSA